MQRTVKKHIWLSDEENESLKSKARKAGLSESEVIRNLIMGYSPREKPSKEIIEFLKELSVIGNNLNQLAAKANAIGVIEEIDLREEIERWRKFRADVRDALLLPVKESD